MNQINEKQNKLKILDCLFSARFYMNKASLWNGCKIFIAIFLIIFQIIPIEITIKEWGLAIISVIGLSLCEYKYKKYIEIGALTKEYIDSHLYNIKSENLKNEDISNIQKYKLKAIKKSKPTYYQKQIENDGISTNRGVKNWYSVDKELELNDAILKCQSENIYWDNNLVNKYRKFLFFLLFLWILFGLFIIIFQKNYLYLISNITNLGIITKELYDSFKYKETYTRIKTILDNSSNFSDKRKAIIEIQKHLFERRKIFIIPDFFHKISNIELHEIFKDMDEN